MGFKCGIVGLPNVGKSTLFNALTKAGTKGVGASNYPFCTIEPNIGNIPVPDARLEAIANIVKPERTLPTTMQFVDIAGLVKGASKGEGLGNKFLANIRETDAILHVVRCFSMEASDIIHVSGRVDPVSDMKDIETELALADLETVEKALIKTEKMVKTGQKEATLEFNILEKAKAHLNQGLPMRILTLKPEEALRLERFCLLTMKPVLYVANVSEEGFENNPLLESVKKSATEQGAKVIALSAAIEAELTELEESERLSYLSTMGLSQSGLDTVIQEGYALLGLQTYFTAGVKEVRAWTIKKGAKAPEAAGVIHTDFTKGFIRAEVIAYNDFIQYRGEQGAKEAGKLRLEGKDYVVADGDVMHFRFNV